MTKKAVSYLNLMAVSCRTFSLLSILIDFSFVANIAIVQSDPDGGGEDIKTACVASPSAAIVPLTRGTPKDH